MNSLHMDKAITSEIGEIIDCLNDCALKDAYFSDDALTRAFIARAVANEELYVCKDASGTVTGFMIIDYAGMFSAFPYLKVIAVKPEVRRHGIGGMMLEYFEETGFARNTKVFLCAGDFNHDAIRLYEENGYVKTGLIPSLYREGFDEHLMMKAGPEV
ncbi:MAG TPA: GNAT family N-acetyltransferase [Spirochaetota bacterium]|nr:GNAT family N-acetyltransferase [Spirochaetota bacterium]